MQIKIIEFVYQNELCNLVYMRDVTDIVTQTHEYNLRDDLISSRGSVESIPTLREEDRGEETKVLHTDSKEES